MISLTMSRISSRADFGVELGELREVDRLDQRAEDRALGLVIVLGVAAVGRRRARGGGRRPSGWLRLAGRRRRERAARQVRPRESARGRLPWARCRLAPAGRRRAVRRRLLEPRRAMAARRLRRRGDAVRPPNCYACRTRLRTPTLTRTRRTTPTLRRTLHQLLEERAEQARSGLLGFGPAGQRLRELAEHLGGPVRRRQLRDHLAVVGGGAEHLRLERDDRPAARRRAPWRSPRA